MPADGHVQIVAAILASLLLLGLASSVGIFFLVFWFNRVEGHIKASHKRNNLMQKYIQMLSTIRRDISTLTEKVDTLDKCCEHCGVKS